jgi:ligand-binding sensor domain-containing protein
VYIDRAGILWVGTEAGTLNRFDPATGHVTRYQPHPGAAPGRPGRRDRRCRGHLWLASDGDGLFRFDKATGRTERFAHDPADEGSLGHNNVSKLLVDRNGALWAGTRGGGLSRRDPRTGRFTRYQHHPFRPDTPASNTIFSLYEDRAGLIWAGTQGHGLDKINTARPNFETYAHNPLTPKGSPTMPCARFTKPTRMPCGWGTNGSGLDCLDPATGQSPPLPPRLHAAGQHERRGRDGPAARRHRGVVGGYLRRRPQPAGPQTGRFSHYVHDPADSGSLADNRVLALCRDRDGNLWVGTFEGGLDRFDPPPASSSTTATGPATRAA